MDYDICKCNAHLKSVRGFGGLLRGIRGGASQVAPLSPLTKLTMFGIARRYENKRGTRAI